MASESVREVLESGTTATKDIKAALSSKGVSASDALINNVRSRWKKSKGMPMGRRGKPGRKQAPVMESTSSHSHGLMPTTTDNGDVLDAAITFCRTAGGLEKARRVLAQLDAIKNL